MPSDGATADEGALYDVELQALDDRSFHLRWQGRHAAGVLAALRHAHLAGPVRQVEWGTHEVVLDGDSARHLLRAVLDDETWGHEPVELVRHPADGSAESIELGNAVDLLEDERFYRLVADLY
jgi:hypothetical protein